MVDHTNLADRAHPSERDVPIPYMTRTRDWYLALGYGNPYVWAHHPSVPFQPLAKPLSESRVTLVTTAAPYLPDQGNQGPGAPYNAAAKFYETYVKRTDLDHDLRISHVAIDRMHTTATDSNTWFPLPALRAAAADGRVGELAEHFYGAPTNRSQRHTNKVDAPRILSACREDGVDAVVLVPNCPVCHQTLSLVARHLEANGVATIMMGAAKDVVEHCGVPRFLFSDLPLGNAAGRPHDPDSQAATLDLALRVLETAVAARTTVQNPLRWSDDSSWKLDYLDVTRLTEQDLARERAENDRIKVTAQAVRDRTLGTTEPQA